MCHLHNLSHHQFVIVLPNHFSSNNSLTFAGMKFWVRYLFKHAFLTKFKLFGILASKFPLTYKKSTIQFKFFWHTQWKYNNTIMCFVIINFLHFSPNTIWEHFKKQQTVKKNLTFPNIITDPPGWKFSGLNKRTCPGKRNAYGSPTVAQAVPQS